MQIKTTIHHLLVCLEVNHTELSRVYFGVNMHQTWLYKFLTSDGVIVGVP